MIKNIILTGASDKYNKLKGVLNFETTSDKTLITLKSQNFLHNNKLILAVKTGNDYFKVELGKELNYLIDKKIDLNEKISAVVLKVENLKTEVLVWGSNETTKVWKNFILNEFKTNENEEKYLEKQNFQQKEKMFEANENKATNFINEVYKESLEDDYETDEYIEQLVDDSINKQIEDELITEEPLNNKSEFLNSIESQINELLNTYEKENALEEIIPNSKFVKVDVENNGNFYIFGVIYENNEIKYIVYGLPGEFNVKPEDEYSNYYQWLPLNNDNPEGYGYYLMYQDALNGNQVEMVLD